MYTAHKDIITEVDYFAKCLKNFEESKTLEITLPEDNPEVFEKLLEYIYYGQIKTKTVDELMAAPDEEKEGYLMLLFNVYVDADKYCMEACQNHVMDFFFQYSHNYYPRPCTIFELGKRGLRTCKLRKFLIHDLSLATKEYSWQQDTILDEDIMQVVTAGGDDAVDYFTACMQRNTEANSSNPPGEKCDWHTHNTTEECD